jgi:DNA-damage-inducible protein D
MIKNRRLNGQQELEEAHKEVGWDVRDMVIKNTGRKPEELPCEMPIGDIKKWLKQAHKELKKVDEKKKLK